MVPVAAFGLFCIGALLYTHPLIFLVILGVSAYVVLAYWLMNTNGKYDGDNGWYI